MTEKLKVGIVGLGMVGGPMRRWFEDFRGYKRGKDLFCYDIDPKKGYSDDIAKAEVIFVCVPSPSNPDGSCNTSFVEGAVAKILDGKIVVVRSTVPPGTVEALQKKHPKKRLLFNPEFLTESQVWEDFISPDRQIVAPTAKTSTDAIEILNLLPRRHFIRPWASDYSKRSVNSTEAELGKYASNVFGYMKVIYGNILADVCYALNKNSRKKTGPGAVEYENIRELLAADLRIGPSWLNVEQGNYCGAGGFCFPKDMNALIVFVESLHAGLKKKKADKQFLAVLSKGTGVLRAIRDYNVELLRAQNLTVKEVALHDREIIVKKRKKFRK